MFRLPYAQSYAQRKVTALAPDFLVYINGDETIEVCEKCGRRTYFNDDITDVNTRLTLSPGGSSASFTLATPRHSENIYVKDGEPVIGPMSEVEIFMKGRFLTDGEPRYYQVFWGLVSTFTEDYSDGVHSVTIECRDILRWWEIMVINIQPAAISTTYNPKEQPDVGKNSRFFGKNPYSIIYNLAQTMGTLQHPASVNIGPKSTNKRAEAPIGMTAAKESLTAKQADLMSYWEKRFNQIGKALRMFGLDGVMLRKDDIALRARSNDKQRFAQGTMPFANERVAITDFVADVTPFPFRGAPDRVESSYRSKLDIAREVADFINFEFYMDVTGEIIFKPPFYNLDVRPNQILNIDDQDIISWSFSEDESQVFTRCDVFGSLTPTEQTGRNYTPLGWAIDQKLARQYGIRQKEIQMGWLSDARACHLYAIGWLDIQNAMRFTGTLAMPGRPELRLGYPIYVKSRDSFYYVEGINHNLNYGGSFTTTLTLRGVRRKFTPPHLAFKGLYTATAEERAASEQTALNFFTGLSGNGEPNVVLVNDTQRRYAPKQVFKRDSVSGQAEIVTVDAPPAGAAAQAQKDFDISTFGTSMGVYTYDTQPGVYQVQVIQNQASVPINVGKSANIPVQTPRAGFKSTVLSINRDFKTVIPVTDESGYDLIGMYPYGRNLKIDARGQLSYNALSGFSSFANLGLLSAAQKVAQGFAAAGAAAAKSILFNKSADTIKNMSGLKDPSSNSEHNPRVNLERLGVNQIVGKSAAILTKNMTADDYVIEGSCSCFGDKTAEVVAKTSLK